MPTFQIIVTTGSGTNQGTLTYAGPEANRIFNAWKARSPARTNATQADFVASMLQDTKNLFTSWCANAETTTPAPPDITVGP
jgi:hypothetical protein